MLRKELSRIKQETRQLEWRRDMRLECLQDLILCLELRYKMTSFVEENTRRAEEKEKTSFLRR